MAERSGTLKLIAIYGANTALTRAITLLSALFLSRYYSFADIGVYGLAYTFAQLVLPVLSGGATAAIVREGVAEPETASRLVRCVAIVASCAALVVAALGQVAGVQATWPLLGFLLGAADCVHTGLISFYQARERPWVALTLTVARVLALLAAIAAAIEWRLAMSDLLVLQIGASFVVAGTALLVGKRPAEPPLLLTPTVRAALAYSVMTLPHSIALWLISGSDRLLLAKLHGTSAVGGYTLAYTVGQVGLILNSGVAAAMATRVASDYEHWSSDGVLQAFLALIGRATVGILLAAMVAVKLDHLFLHLVVWPIDTIFVLVGILMAAFYVSNFYIAYAAFLFYHRNTWIVSAGTLVAAPLTVAATFLLVRAFGTAGAAIGTMVGYVFMAGAYLYGVRSRSGEFATGWRGHVGVGVRYGGAMIAIGLAFQYLGT